MQQNIFVNKEVQPSVLIQRGDRVPLSFFFLRNIPRNSLQYYKVSESGHVLPNFIRLEVSAVCVCVCVERHGQ